MGWVEGITGGRNSNSTAADVKPRLLRKYSSAVVSDLHILRFTGGESYVECTLNIHGTSAIETLVLRETNEHRTCRLEIGDK